MTLAILSAGASQVLSLLSVVVRSSSEPGVRVLLAALAGVVYETQETRGGGNGWWYLPSLFEGLVFLVLAGMRNQPRLPLCPLIWAY